MNLLEANNDEIKWAMFKIRKCLSMLSKKIAWRFLCFTNIFLAMHPHQRSAILFFLLSFFKGIWTFKSTTLYPLETEFAIHCYVVHRCLQSSIPETSKRWFFFFLEESPVFFCYKIFYRLKYTHKKETIQLLTFTFLLKLLIMYSSCSNISLKGFLTTECNVRLNIASP